MSDASGRLMRRRLVAFAGHAPGLWLFYREPVPRELWALNVILLGLTAAATAAAAVATEGAARWPVAIATWAVGHVIWGAILAARLPAEPPT